MRVGLFVPCYVDQLAPSVGLAALDVLEGAGCQVDYDPRVGCCGQPLLTMGAGPEAARLARAWLEGFAAAEAVVCPSASCVATVRKHYGELGVGALHDVRERTFELTEFLVRRLGCSDLGAVFPHRVAVLESCHGLRDLGLGQPSELGGDAPAEPGVLEQLLAHVEGLELARAERRDECCGFGGAFSVRFPTVSARMGRARLELLEKTGAAYVTGTDVSCLLHLDGLRRRAGHGPRPLHVAEILAARA